MNVSFVALISFVASLAFSMSLDCQRQVERIESDGEPAIVWSIQETQIKW